MKKRWTKILVLALVGAMLLLMTACEKDDIEEILPLPTDEVAARAVILEEINAYRAEFNNVPLKEEPQIEELCATLTKQFETRNVLSLTDYDLDYSEYWSLQPEVESKWNLYNDWEGFDWTAGKTHTLKFEYVDLPTLREQIRSSHKLNDYEDDSIGIVLVKVQGKTYWIAQTARTVS